MPLLRTLLPMLLLATRLGAGEPPAPPFKARPMAELIAEARGLQPAPALTAGQAADLVELKAVDPNLRIDLRYATPDNFIRTAIYDQARAFLQRPVAEALVRANRTLQRSGATLRILDAYRPWWVTKVFWEATDPKDRVFVADPAKGSIHNRGGAVDVDLVSLADGAPLEMPSGYDEMSPRSHATYPGGSEAARRNRDLLRAAMEAEGFKVEPEEWWHFSHTTSRAYPVLNVPFEAIVGPPADLKAAGQVIRVITPDWDAPKGLLQRFERTADGTLVPVGAPLTVWVGTKGMGWRTDEGAAPPPAPGPLKREGDGKSPAGVLTFGQLWGYAATPPEGVRFPYRQATDCDRCVDDKDHPAYNQLVRLPSAKAPEPWKSAEKLLLDTEHYRYMMVIRYNDARPKKAAGSCIFLHIAPPPGGGTAGCTALAVDDLLTLLRWMDPAKQPVLVQVPAPAYAAAQAAWSLPATLRP